MKNSSVPLERAPFAAASDNSVVMEQAAERKLSLVVRVFPILFFLTYLNATVLLFAFGPWHFPVDNETQLYTFLILAHLALLLGYLSGAFGSPRGYYGKWSVQSVLLTSAILNLVLLIPTSLLMTGAGLPNILNGIANPGAAYLAALTTWAAPSAPLAVVSWLRIFLGPLLALALPLTVFYWQRLNLPLKLLGLLAVLGGVAIYIAAGINKGVADLVTMAPWLILAAWLSGKFKVTWLYKLGVVVLAGAGLVGLAIFFTAGQSTRQGSFASSRYFGPTNTAADLDNVLVRDLPPNAQTGVLAISGYLTMGYYALSLSLDQPWVPTYGVGNSLFTLRNAARITGIDELNNMPYPFRINWDAIGAWSSIYPWIASDVSFPGTLIVVFLIGRLFALSWLDTLKGDNLFAVAMFAQFLIVLYYFPANNQAVQGGEQWTAFYITLALWLYTRKDRSPQKRMRG